MKIKSLKGDEWMGNGEQVGSSSNRQLSLAAIGAITGGLLLAINNIWQGYLEVTSGNYKILEDVTHYAYYLNNSIQIVAMCGLLLGAIRN